MTELSPPDESAAAQPSLDWPRINQDEVPDHLVQQSLARLDVVSKIPVAEHEAAYSELHDELRAALDADPAEQPRPGANFPKSGA